MRIYLWFLWLFALLILPSGGATQSAKPDISVTISAMQTVVKADSEVKVGIILTNISNHEVSLAKDNAQNLGEAHNKIEVRDEKGNLAPEAKYVGILDGKAPNDVIFMPLGSSAPHSLKPGETLKDAIIASKLFDLSKPGKYTIQVQRTDEATKTVVRSNTITLTVTP